MLKNRLLFRNSRRRDSALAEAVISTAAGFIISWALTAFFSAWLGWGLGVSGQLGVTAVYTAVSVARGYLIRRAFARWQAESSI